MSTFEWIAAVVVGVMSAARITRLVTWDEFPPSVWIRTRYYSLAGENWGKLLSCPWCFGPWAALFVLLWAYIWELPEVWWLFNGWLAAGYAASIVVAYDGED